MIKLASAIAALPRRYDRIYSRCKIKTDPLYGAVTAELDPRFPLLDIGCGMGLLAFYLRSVGYENRITGFDYDVRKTTAASAVVDRLGLSETSFYSGDARDGLPDHSGQVTILDILQFMSAEEQVEVIRQASRRVAPGGKLIIRSGLIGKNWRFRVTRACDFFARAVRWMKDVPREYPTQETFRKPLEAEGFKVEIQPLAGKTPFHNFLITAVRPAEA